MWIRMLLQKSCPLVVSVWRHLQQPPALLFSIIWIIIHDLIKKVGGKWGFKILNCRFWMRTWTKICTTTPVPTPNFQKILQRLIKCFMDLNFEMAYSSEEIRFLRSKVNCFENKFWNTLEQEQNEELPKYINWNFDNDAKTLERFIATHHTSKKDWCRAAPMRSSVSLCSLISHLFKIKTIEKSLILIKVVLYIHLLRQPLH